MKRRRPNRSARPARSPRSRPAPVDPVAGRRRHLRHELRLALAVLVAFVAFELWLGHTAIGHGLRSSTLDWLQHAVPSGPPRPPSPVLLVDLAALPLEPDPDSPDGPRITPRDTLLAVLERCRLARALHPRAPLALGFDLDLSPETNGTIPSTAATRRFLEAGLRSVREGLPVFVGVHRLEALGPAAWLGDPDYAPLAVSLSRHRGPVARMPFELRFASGQPPLPSLSRALADACVRVAGTAPSHAPSWLDAILVAVQRHDDVAGIQGYGVADYLVDFSRRSELAAGIVDYRRLLAMSPTELAARLEGRIVLVGDASTSSGPDVAIVPGSAEPVPGLLAHACGVDTLVGRPLREPHHLAGLALTFGLSLAAILLIHRACDRFATQGEVSPVALTVLLATLLAGLCLAAAWFAMRLWNVVVLDAFGVVFVLAAHTLTEVFLGAVDWHRLRHHPTRPLPALVLRPPPAEPS